jgi:hypothetical protein
LREEKPGIIAITSTILLALFFWFVTFRLAWGVFWIKISCSAALLSLLALTLESGILKRIKFSPTVFVTGLLSTALLYAIFWTGRILSTKMFPFAAHQITGIYQKGTDLPSWLVALILFFVTAPFEEIYWRGFLQHNLMKRYGDWQGWILSTSIYAGVHIWSFNLMLIGAAAVAGAYWGLMYLRLKNLAPVIISHSLWSVFIFSIVPLR